MKLCKTCTYSSDPLKRSFGTTGSVEVYYCDHYEKRMIERDSCDFYIESPKAYWERQKKAEGKK